MSFLIPLIVIGFVVGWLSSTITEGRGLGLKWSLILSVGGSLLAGIIFAAAGARLVGEDPLFLASLVAGSVGAIGLIVTAGYVKR